MSEAIAAAAWICPASSMCTIITDALRPYEFDRERAVDFGTVAAGQTLAEVKLALLVACLLDIDNRIADVEDGRSTLGKGPEEVYKLRSNPPLSIGQVGGRRSQLQTVFEINSPDSNRRE